MQEEEKLYWDEQMSLEPNALAKFAEQILHGKKKNCRAAAANKPPTHLNGMIAASQAVSRRNRQADEGSPSLRDLREAGAAELSEQAVVSPGCEPGEARGVGGAGEGVRGGEKG
jgi:hypothetical protein